MGGPPLQRFLTSCIVLTICALPFRPAQAQRARLVLNEVLYDPPGADGDREFVELYVDGDAGLSLDGVALRFVNGASPDASVEVWRAPDSIWLDSGQFVVIGEAEVAGRDYSAELNLQNGPDALLLLRGSMTLDSIAWGAVAGSGEGQPAADVSGQSLGRVPDGFDSDDNSRDFRALPQPTPGLINLPSSALRIAALEVDPPWSARSKPRRLRIGIVAEGFAALQHGTLFVEPIMAEEPLQVAVADTSVVEVEVYPGTDRQVLRLRVFVDGRVEEPFDERTLTLITGPQDIVLNEVMARPASAEPEWIELYNRGAAQVDLDGYAIADRARQPRFLVEPGVLLPDGYVLVCADPAELQATRTLPPGVRVLGVDGGWPTLNNMPTAAGESADEALLFDGSGAVVDWLVYGSGLLDEAGRSMERGFVSFSSPSNWFIAPNGSSPGLRNDSAAMAPPDEDGLHVSPSPFSPDGDGSDDVLHVWMKLPPGFDAPRAQVLDLGGERVRELSGGQGDGEHRQWLWDGTDSRGRELPSGAYVVRVEARGERGSSIRQWRRLVALGRRP